MSTLPTRYDLETELFSILKSINDLQRKIKIGDISLPFYRTSIEKKFNEFHLIELILKKKGMNLEKVLRDMHIEEISNEVLRLKDLVLFENVKVEHRSKKSQESKIEDFEFKNIEPPESNSKTMRDTITSLDDKQSRLECYALVGDVMTNPIALAKLSSEITSDFITILDFFQLNLKEMNVFYDIGDHLEHNLKLFPKMETLAIDLSSFLKNKTTINKMKYEELSKKFENYFYIFKKNINANTS